MTLLRNYMFTHLFIFSKKKNNLTRMFSIYIFTACEKDCAALKHHLDECNERVENGSSENCNVSP